METLINKEDDVEESFIFGKPISKDPNDIKIFVKIVYNKENFEAKTETEIKEYFNEKIKSQDKPAIIDFQKKTSFWCLF